MKKGSITLFNFAFGVVPIFAQFVYGNSNLRYYCYYNHHFSLKWGIVVAFSLMLGIFTYNILFKRRMSDGKTLLGVLSGNVIGGLLGVFCFWLGVQFLRLRSVLYEWGFYRLSTYISRECMLQAEVPVFLRYFILAIVISSVIKLFINRFIFKEYQFKKILWVTFGANLCSNLLLARVMYIDCFL